MTSDRLCYFLPSLDGGGAEHNFVDLANWMVKNRRQVDFLLGSAHGRWLEHLDPAVRVVDLKRRRVVSSIPGLRRYLTKERPRAVMSGMTHANLALILASRVLGRYPGRIIVQEVNRLDDTRVKAYGPRERRFIALSRYLYPMADVVLAISASIEREVQANQGRRAINLVRQPIPLDLALIRKKAREQPDHPWLAPDSAPLIMAVGRLGPEKGFDTLLRAFALARRERKLKLIILGEGTQRAILEDMVAQLGLGQDVELPGFSTNPQAYLARADLFVLSSLAEGFSLALAEALACGCNVVVTSCGEEPLAMVARGRFGTVVPVNDPEAMARAILQRLENPLEAEVLKARAQPYDIDSVGAAFLKLMETKV